MGIVFNHIAPSTIIYILKKLLTQKTSFQTYDKHKRGQLARFQNR